MISFQPTAKFDKEAVVVLCSQEQIQNKKISLNQRQVKDTLLAAVEAKQFKGENGQIFPVIDGKNLFLFVGVGKKKDNFLTALRITLRKALTSSYLKNVKGLEIILHDQDDEVVKAVIEGVVIGTYAWKKYISKEKDDESVDFDKKQVVIIVEKKKVYEETLSVAQGVNFARNLVNDNADVVTSEFMEKTIRDLIKGSKNISIEVLNRKEMQEKGLGLHLAVNQGSNKEPKLVIVKYNGGEKNEKYTALIGKGMTYDTGGLNLKPSGHIETMKIDMSGSAAIVGTLKNTVELGIKKNILFVCAFAENAIGPAAYKPGDVFRGYAGKTVEIANTDAEGRLVLADAFAYVIKNYKPARIIDIATLTGACVVALGHDYTGLVTTDDDMSRQLVKISNETDDRVWRLPVYPELKDAVKSQIADIRNLGFPKGAAGTITAAEFLRQFSEDTPWAHLDIAGTAYVDNGNRMYFAHGSTGAGVRLLTRFVQNV